MTDLPPLPHPQALCERPDCDHEQAEHSRVLGMRCGVAWCDCPQFVGEDTEALMRALAEYAASRT